MGTLAGILPMRERSTVIKAALKGRLDTLVPLAMREAGLDAWIITCQEDNPDPMLPFLIPMDTWTPILTILLFFLKEDGQTVERINLSMTDTADLYARPWSGRQLEEQWALLGQFLAERNPRAIGINIGSVEWAAGGLTHNLYQQLCRAVPAPWNERLVSAEQAATRFLATLTEEEIGLFEDVVRAGKDVIRQCYSRATIQPGVTTSTDLVWTYWQIIADAGLDVSFKPYFTVHHAPENLEKYGADDRTIYPGDLIHCDVGLKYLRLNSDHQQWAYILKPGEEQPPQGIRHLMQNANRLQDIYMAEFREGLTGNELLRSILDRARGEGIPNPKVYSHSLGLFLHEPGPLIGLPWEQERCPGRGDVTLHANQAFTMELSVRDQVAEWGGRELTLSIEEDVVFDGSECRVLVGRQTEFALIDPVEQS